MRYFLLVAVLSACGDTVARNLPDAPEIDAAPIDAEIDAPSMSNVISLDFESTLPPSVDVGNAQLTPSQGFAPLGPAGGTFGPTFLRSETGNTITVTLGSLPPHSTLSIGLLFAAIDSLDGTGTFPAGDFMRITLDGAVLMRESFANALDTQIQSYEGPPEGVLARKVDLGFSGPGGNYRDSAYDLAVDPRFRDIAHTASAATLVFQLEGAGVQSLDDESWAIDNLQVIAKL